MSKSTSDLTPEEVCNKHDQLIRIEYFCKSHDELCCRACLADKHKSCSDVIVIYFACKNAKTELLGDTKSETKHILETLESINKEAEINLSNMNRNSQRIRREIADAKSEAINRLDQAEQDLINELNNKTDEFNGYVQNRIDSVKDIRKSSIEKLKQIEFVEKHGTEKQAFFLAQKFKSYLKEVEAPIQEVTSMSAMALGFDKSVATNVLLGDITKTEETERVAKYTPLKQRQAQFNVESSKPLTLFQLSVESSKPLTSFQFISEFETTCSNPFMLGMIATDDGKLLLCNHRIASNDGGIYVYQQTGHFIKKIALENPFDITHIKSTNQFAVTLTYSRSIQFICGKSLKCSHVIKLDCEYIIYGITATENQIFIGGRSEVIEINTDGSIKETTALSNCDYVRYIEKTKKNVYVSLNEGVCTKDMRPLQINF